jgi:hypothetical protein
MEAGAVGSGGNKPTLVPGTTNVQGTTGCDFKPHIGGGMELIFCKLPGVLPSAGVEVGDTILSINGTPVNDLLGLIDAVNKARFTAQPDECVIIDHRTGNIAVLHIAF